MKQKLFGNNIQPACEVCLFGRRAVDGKTVLCPQRGVVPLYYSCRRFKYDPLKRMPRRNPSLPKHRAEEFTLD
ncbi:MAG: hypothetical protein FWE80_05120 [Oscillospiraceae bacterium]|nr:hypothetical protein [Oscillospiraceae bacterium]